MPLNHVALHANTPEITMKGTAGPVCSLSLLRTHAQSEKDEPPRHLLSRILGDQLTRYVSLHGARLMKGDIPVHNNVWSEWSDLEAENCDGDTILRLTTKSGQPIEQPAGGKIRIPKRFTWLPADTSYKNKNIAGDFSRD